MAMTSGFSMGKSGRFLAVAAAHVVLIYAVATSLGIIKIPNLIKPMEAVMINVPENADNWKPPVPKPNLDQPKIDIPLDQPVPEIPVEVADTAPAAISANTAEQAQSADLKVTSRVEPIYPAVSRRASEEGTGVFRVLVDAAGLPTRVEVVKSSGFARLDQAAEEAIKRWRFAAAMQGNASVSAWTTVRVTFRLNR